MARRPKPRSETSHSETRVWVTPGEPPPPSRKQSFITLGRGGVFPHPVSQLAEPPIESRPTPGRQQRQRAPDLSDDQFRRHLEDAGRKLIEANKRLTKTAVTKLMPVAKTAFDEYLSPERCDIDWDQWEADIERKYRRS